MEPRCELERKVNKMGKTVVRYCDICKREIEADGFRIRIKRGKRFYSGLINGIESVDICDDCISVISDIVNHKINIDNLTGGDQ